MLTTTSRYLFMTTLILGTIMACSSTSWVLAWIGLEINLMSFIPLLINKLTTQSMETSIKYFLVQAMASMIIIFISIFITMKSLNSFIIEVNLFLSFSLCLKAGVAPLHFWFPQVMEFSEWFQAMLILTWQKIAPLILLSFNLNLMVFIAIFSSAIIGMMGGINQLSLSKIMTYSSIIHSAWLISISFISDTVWWNYFIIYCMMVISIVIPLSTMNMKYVNNINTFKLSYQNKMLMFLNFLSLAGLPPFMGFFIKMISLNLMILNKFNLLIILTLIISSLMSFYFYSRVMYSSFLLSHSNMKTLYISSYKTIFISKMILFSLSGSLLISFLVLLS